MGKSTASSISGAPFPAWLLSRAFCADYIDDDPRAVSFIERSPSGLAFAQFCRTNRQRVGNPSLWLRSFGRLLVLDEEENRRLLQERRDETEEKCGNEKHFAENARIWRASEIKKEVLELGLDPRALYPATPITADCRLFRAGQKLLGEELMSGACVKPSKLRGRPLPAKLRYLEPEDFRLPPGNARCRLKFFNIHHDADGRAWYVPESIKTEALFEAVGFSLENEMNGQMPLGKMAARSQFAGSATVQAAWLEPHEVHVVEDLRFVGEEGAEPEGRPKAKAKGKAAAAKPKAKRTKKTEDGVEVSAQTDGCGRASVDIFTAIQEGLVAQGMPVEGELQAVQVRIASCKLMLTCDAGLEGRRVEIPWSTVKARPLPGEKEGCWIEVVSKTGTVDERRSSPAHLNSEVLPLLEFWGTGGVRGVSDFIAVICHMQHAYYGRRISELIEDSGFGLPLSQAVSRFSGFGFPLRCSLCSRWRRLSGSALEQFDALVEAQKGTWEPEVLFSCDLLQNCFCEKSRVDFLGAPCPHLFGPDLPRDYPLGERVYEFDLESARGRASDALDVVEIAGEVPEPKMEEKGTDRLPDEQSWRFDSAQKRVRELENEDAFLELTTDDTGAVGGALEKARRELYMKPPTGAYRLDPRSMHDGFKVLKSGAQAMYQKPHIPIPSSVHARLMPDWTRTLGPRECVVQHRVKDNWEYFEGSVLVTKTPSFLPSDIEVWKAVQPTDAIKSRIRHKNCILCACHPSMRTSAVEGFSADYDGDSGDLIGFRPIVELVKRGKDAKKPVGDSRGASELRDLLGILILVKFEQSNVVGSEVSRVICQIVDVPSVFGLG